MEQATNKTAREIEILKQGSIHAWLTFEHIKTETGQELDFYNHRYLHDIYSDDSPFLACRKAGQIGFSTMAILKTIWLCRNKHMDCGYILPTEEMVQKFVGSKVNRLAQQNEVINKWFKEKDSISQKQIDENYIHYLGAMTNRSAIMLSLDLLCADEYDKAPQEILEIYDSRLQHSKFGWKWVFSNPTIPDFGVDKFWAISDKKKWHIKHSCGEIYILDEDCIDYQTEIYRCPKCKQEITDEERRLGEWKKTDEGKYSGYWIPLWLNPKISASKIAEYKRTKTAEYFYNFVAGLPYVNANDALSERALERCLSPQPNTQGGRVIIGLDSGNNLYYVMGNKEGIFFQGYCETPEENKQSHRFPVDTYDPYDEIEKRLLEYPRSIIFSDQGGDLIGIRKLQAKYPGRVFLVWFSKETKNKELLRWGEGEEYGKVLADRNRVMQLVVDEINEQRITFNGTKEDWEPLFKHALNIYRVKEIIGDESDPVYGWRFVWHRKSDDHLFLALCYLMIGMDRFSEDLAVIVKKDPFIKDVPTGYQENSLQPLNAKIIKKEQEWIRGDVIDF